MPFSPQTTEIRLNNLKGQKTMTKAQHTLGPWWPIQNSAGAWYVKTYRDSCENPQEEIGGIYGAFICTSIGDRTETRTSGNEEANARLIAAAPDLLEALKRSAESLRIASETFGSEKLLSDCMYALAAIAKAEGSAE